MAFRTVDKSVGERPPTFIPETVTFLATFPSCLASSIAQPAIPKEIMTIKKPMQAPIKGLEANEGRYALSPVFARLGLFLCDDLGEFTILVEYRKLVTWWGHARYPLIMQALEKSKNSGLHPSKIIIVNFNS